MLSKGHLFGPWPLFYCFADITVSFVHNHDAWWPAIVLFLNPWPLFCHKEQMYNIERLVRYTALPLCPPASTHILF